jgi:quinol monooxygenase YgiN
MTSAFIMTFAVDGAAADAYDRVMEDMELDGRMPAGGVWHYAGPYEGGWRVVDLWEDEAAYERFAEEKIGPIAGRHGFSPPKVERIPVEDVSDGDDGEGRFLQVVRLPFDGDAFRSLDEQVRPGGQAPDDLVHHVNGPGPDGNWVVIDSWTSKEARDRFLESRVFPNVPEGAPQPTLEDLEVHNTMS